MKNMIYCVWRESREGIYSHAKQLSNFVFKLLLFVHFTTQSYDLCRVELKDYLRSISFCMKNHKMTLSSSSFSSLPSSWGFGGYLFLSLWYNLKYLSGFWVFKSSSYFFFISMSLSWSWHLFQCRNIK